MSFSNRFIKAFHRATNSVGELFLWYYGSRVLAGLLFAFFEHATISDSIWWATVASSTTGYGDIFPKTLGGRIVHSVLVDFSLLIVLPLVIIKLQDIFHPPSDVFTEEEQREVLAGLKFLREEVERIETKMAAE